MASLKPVSRTTLSEQVAMQIVGMISSGKWKPGEKVPSEAQLCEVFRVGRSTLREALKSLAFVGIVHMRPGGGTYVAVGSSKFLEHTLSPHLLKMERMVSDVSEARIILEPDLAALCAQRITDAELAHLEDLTREMEAHTQEGGERLMELDVDFHVSIAAGSKNQVLTHAYVNLRSLISEYIGKIQEVPGARELALQQHRAILQALKERNPRKARRVMREHLRVSQRRYELLIETTKSEPEAASEPATTSSGVVPS
jgi:GntR family transcriptional repressor for pyruvate dehydrogenase complex